MRAALVASPARIRGIAEPPRNSVGVPVSSTASGVAPSWIAVATYVIGASGTAALGGSGVVIEGEGCGSPQLTSKATEPRNRGRNLIAIRAGTLSRRHRARTRFSRSISRLALAVRRATTPRLPSPGVAHWHYRVVSSRLADRQSRSGVATRVFAAINHVFPCNAEHQSMARPPPA